MSKELKAFIFDLDGVITDTAQYHFRAWSTIAEELGICLPKQLNEQLKGLSRIDSLEKILAYVGREKEFSTEDKAIMATRKNNVYLSLIEGLNQNDLLPGMKELFEEIINNGYKLALASASKNARLVIEALQINDYFKTIVDASTIKHGKPHPEIFLTAASLIDVEPTTCIGIEDSIAGIEAIKAANMYAIAIGDKALFPLADLIYEQTHDMTFANIVHHYWQISS